MAEQTEPQPSEPTTDQTGTAQATATTDSAQAELEAARARADEYHRNWQRSAADFANFKRRVDEEKKFAERWLLKDLLPVLDDFERAWAALPRELRSLSWIEGVWQVNAKLFAVLQQHGITPIESEGKPFDPVEHEAVLHEEGDPSEQTEVAAELQRGYRLHERVLRPALVKVGKPKQTEAATTPGDRPSPESPPAPQ